MKYNLKYRAVLAVYACCMQLMDAAMCSVVLDGRSVRILEILPMFFGVMAFSFALVYMRCQVGSCRCFERILFAYDMILLVLYVSVLAYTVIQCEVIGW